MRFLAQAALEGAGIEFAVTAPASPEFGLTPILSPVSQILVAEKDVPQAGEVLAMLPVREETAEGEALPGAPEMGV